MPRKPIYVEIMIQTDIALLWKYTQDRLRSDFGLKWLDRLIFGPMVGWATA